MEQSKSELNLLRVILFMLYSEDSVIRWTSVQGTDLSVKLV